MGILEITPPGILIEGPHSGLVIYGMCIAIMVLVWLYLRSSGANKSLRKQKSDEELASYSELNTTLKSINKYLADDKNKRDAERQILDAKVSVVCVHVKHVERFLEEKEKYQPIPWEDHHGTS